MAYFYRIKFDNDTHKDVIPEQLIGKKLAMFDNFSMSSDFENFINATCVEFNVTKQNIEDIKIVKQDRRLKEIEYNLLEDNPYFYDVFQSVSVKEVYEYNYKTDREIISTGSECYHEMKDYLFNQLKRNSRVFFDSIYKLRGLNNSHFGVYSDFKYRDFFLETSLFT